MRKEIDGKVFISHQSWHFPSDVCILEVIFSICTLIWRVNNYVSHQEKGINGINESAKGLNSISCPSIYN